MSFAAPVYVSEEEEAMPLLQVPPQWELAVLALFDGLEVRSARRLDRVDQLRGSGTGQKRRRDSKATVFLHHAAERTDCTVLEWIQARATGRHLEELETLVPGATGDNWGAAAVLHRYTLQFIYTAKGRAETGQGSRVNEGEIEMEWGKAMFINDLFKASLGN